MHDDQPAEPATSQPLADVQPPPAASPTREVHHEYTLNWAPILQHIRASLLVSTYQAGKIVMIGRTGDTLELSYHNFEKAMGIAVKPGRVAVGTRSAVWILTNDPAIARRIEPTSERDACYLTRSAIFTGEIQGHELAWAEDQLWIVNTAFSCLCTLDQEHSFVPQWRPRFISAFAAEDRCHLNGFAFQNGQPKLVSALAQTNTPQGWRASKANTGALIDVESNETIAHGLAMPHSPRIHRDHIWLLNSGHGELVQVDPRNGQITTVTRLPGYTRGLALCDTFAFVGLSRIRETSTFGGLPIAQRRDELKCGVAVIDLISGRQMAFLEFHSGIEEIFDIQLLPQIQSPVLSGPHPHLDGNPAIWTIPLNPKWTRQDTKKPSIPPIHATSQISLNKLN